MGYFSLHTFWRNYKCYLTEVNALVFYSPTFFSSIFPQFNKFTTPLLIAVWILLSINCICVMHLTAAFDETTTKGSKKTVYI